MCKSPCSHLHFLLLAQSLHSVNKLFKLHLGVEPVGPVLHLLHEQPQVLHLLGQIKRTASEWKSDTRQVRRSGQVGSGQLSRYLVAFAFKSNVVEQSAQGGKPSVGGQSEEKSQDDVHHVSCQTTTSFSREKTAQRRRPLNLVESSLGCGLFTVFLLAGGTSASLETSPSSASALVIHKVQSAGAKSSRCPPLYGSESVQASLFFFTFSKRVSLALLPPAWGARRKRIVIREDIFYWIRHGVELLEERKGRR